MIKTILVPATGSDADTAVFASALAVARRFDAHLDFLHIRVDLGGDSGQHGLGRRRRDNGRGPGRTAR